MSIIQTFLRNGDLAVYHNYRLGHANDLSGNDNHGELINSPSWDRNGITLSYVGNQAIRIADAASIDLQTLTVVAYMDPGRITQRSALTTIAVKWNPGFALSWGIRGVESLPGLAVLDHSGGSSSWNAASKPFMGASYLGFNVVNGDASSPSYVDGQLADPSIAAPTINTNNTFLWIGNYHGLNRGWGRTLSTFFLVNRVLLPDEHSQLYGELRNDRHGVLI